MRLRAVDRCSTDEGAAGRRLGVVEAAEMLAAEVLSALPADEPDDDEEGGARGGDTAPETHEAWSPLPRAVVFRSADLDAGLRRLVEGLESAAAFELDARLWPVPGGRGGSRGSRLRPLCLW